jgi:putative protease
MDQKIGKVTHYYNKIGVAVVELKKPLNVGDKIKISGHDKEFTQDVVSMQMEHQMLEKAKAKASIGLKVDQPVRENDEVFKVVV